MSWFGWGDEPEQEPAKEPEPEKREEASWFSWGDDGGDKTDEEKKKIHLDIRKLIENEHNEDTDTRAATEQILQAMYQQADIDAVRQQVAQQVDDWGIEVTRAEILDVNLDQATRAPVPEQEGAYLQGAIPHTARDGAPMHFGTDRGCPVRRFKKIGFAMKGTTGRCCATTGSIGRIDPPQKSLTINRGWWFRVELGLEIVRVGGSFGFSVSAATATREGIDGCIVVAIVKWIGATHI